MFFFSQSNDALVNELVALLIAILTSILGPGPVDTTTMTAAVVIVTESNAPNGNYVVMDGDSYNKAYSMVNALDTWVYDMSGGMGDVDVTVIEHAGTISFTSFHLGGQYPNVDVLRNQYGLWGYDAVIVIADPDADTVDNGYGGLAGSYPKTANIWTPAIGGGENHLVHEFGHGVETQLIARGYQSLPWCNGEASPLHCSGAFGYGWVASYDWMTAFFSGRVNGSLGVNQEGWSLLAN